MIQLPNDVARCPGNPLIDLKSAVIYTDPSCEGCHRLIAAREATAAWIEAGRPTRSATDRTPDTRVAWMTSPTGWPCTSRIDDQHPHAVDHDRRAQEKSPTGCNRSGSTAA